MNLLLDTHVALWFLQQPGRLGPDTARAIKEAESVHVSVASIWEITIKHSLGKLGPPKPVVDAMNDARIRVLDINTPHVLAVANSPLPHNDPFDRLITAQAQVQKWSLCTADRKILSAALAFMMDART